MRYAAALLVLFLPAVCFAQDAQDCHTDQASFWICAGDLAWVNGYLVPPTVLDLRDCMLWEEKAKLLPECIEQRDEFQKQRDQALAEVTSLEQQYAEALEYGDGNRELYEDCHRDLEDRFEVWEVGLIAGGTGLGAILLGLVIGGFAM